MRKEESEGKKKDSELNREVMGVDTDFCQLSTLSFVPPRPTVIRDKGLIVPFLYSGMNEPWHLAFKIVQHR